MRERFEVASGKTGTVLRTLVNDRTLSHERVVLASADGQARVGVLSCDSQGSTLSAATVELLSIDDGHTFAKRTIEFVAEVPDAHIRVTVDIDHDGWPDLIVSMFEDLVSTAMGEATWPRGEVFVLSGSDLSTLRELTAEHAIARFGYAIDSGADIDGDGVQDILTTERGDGFTRTRFTLRAFSGADGHLLREHDGGLSFGSRVAFVGDADGDGIADYAISTVYIEDGTTTEPGSVILFSGRTGKELRKWSR